MFIFLSVTESKLFGVPLATLLETDQKMKPNSSIPLFLQTVCICMLCMHSAAFQIVEINIRSTYLHTTEPDKTKNSCNLCAWSFDHIVFVELLIVEISRRCIFWCQVLLMLFVQLLSFLEKKGVDSEGILRVPGSQSRIKVQCLS